MTNRTKAQRQAMRIISVHPCFLCCTYPEAQREGLMAMLGAIANGEARTLEQALDVLSEQAILIDRELFEVEYRKFQEQQPVAAVEGRG